MGLFHQQTNYSFITPSAETTAKSKDIMTAPNIAYAIVMILNENQLEETPDKEMKRTLDIF